jgi:hypothetical protein
VIGVADRGTYYDETRLAEPNPLARDRLVRQRLHDLTVARMDRAGLREGCVER